MAGKKVGRKKILPTPEMLADIERYAAQGMTMEQIAPLIGMHVSTLHEKQNEFPEIHEALKKGQNKGIAFVTNKLMELVKDKNPASTMFYLKCRAGWKENDPLVQVVQPVKIKVDGKVVEME